MTKREEKVESSGKGMQGSAIYRIGSSDSTGIFNGLEKELQPSAAYATEAKMVWDDLKERYFQGREARRTRAMESTQANYWVAVERARTKYRSEWTNIGAVEWRKVNRKCTG
ncbi:hypothetical protein CRG98_026124 [Punica granatum]|uniref:Uncharacterized protein n=1 Tax=Punica granatum TaxID=22663 RepID=A0A2I0JB00_PUNGR|nr:hypothetical protein CRG98_026124 [Punica granatum]